MRPGEAGLWWAEQPAELDEQMTSLEEMSNARARSSEPWSQPVMSSLNAGARCRLFAARWTGAGAFTPTHSAAVGAAWWISSGMGGYAPGEPARLGMAAISRRV